MPRFATDNTPIIPVRPAYITSRIEALQATHGHTTAAATREVLDIIDVIYLDLQNITCAEPSDALVIAALGAVLQLRREV
jgi:hypothetical protein